MLYYRKIEVLPQVLGICWFNSVLMVLLYSEGLRKIVKEQLKKTTPIENNKFIKTLKYIIDNNYNYPENITKLFRGRFTLEFLLFKYIELYNKTYLNKYLKLRSRKNIYSLGQFHYYMLISMLKDLKINFKDLYYYDNYLYEEVLSNKVDIFNENEDEDEIDPNKKNFDEPPEIIVLFNENIFPNFNKYKLFNDEYINSLTLQMSKKPKYHINRDSGIPDYKEEIIFNGVKYKLESCLLLNTNSEIDDGNHVISGITYNDESFVYNGWTITNENKSLFKSKKACNLFKRDWKDELYNESSDFCINKNYCSLPIAYDDKELCFNFSKSNRVLIYVKIDSSESISHNKYIDVSGIIDNINSASLKYSSQSLKEYLRDYFDLNNRTIDDLKEQLIKIGYDKITVDKLTPRNIRFNLEDEYKTLFKVKQTDTNDIIVKKFIIKLIKRFIKDYYVYNYINLFRIDERDIKNLERSYLFNLNKEAIYKIYNYLYPEESFVYISPIMNDLEYYINKIIKYNNEDKKLLTNHITYDLSEFSLNKEKKDSKLLNKYINFDLSKYSKGGYIKKKRVLNKYISKK